MSAAKPVESGRCRACGEPLESAVYCFACQAVQSDGRGVDAFALFGLPRSHRLDAGALERAYERLSLALHPDLFATAPAEELAAAQRLAAAINEGYRTLRDEPARARYLLELLAGAGALDTKALPQGFLQEMFLLQEAVDELDADAGEAERQAHRQPIQERLERVREERAERFRVLEAAATPSRETLQAVQSNLNQENYLRRLLERLEGERD